MDAKLVSDEVRPFLIDGALGLWEIADVQPDRVALIDVDGNKMSYGELREWTDAISAELLRQGLTAGDTIATVIGNMPAAVAIQLATSQLGIYYTPVNWHLTAPEIEYILGDSEAKMLFVSSEYADTATAAADAVGLPMDKRFAVGALPGYRDIAEIPDAGPVDSSVRRLGQRMLYTSGTTGRPKGVRKPTVDTTPELALAASIPPLTRRMSWPAGPGVHLCVAPLYHAAPNGFGLNALQLGQTLVLMHKWTPEDCLRLIERYQVTATHMVPTMFHRLLALPDEVRDKYDHSSLNYVVHAAAPCPVHEKQAMIDWWGPVIYEYYASTEGGGTSVRPEAWLQHPGTVGRGWDDGVEVEIHDEQGNLLPAGEIGTVYIRSGETFSYYKDPDKTAAAWRGDVFTMGDMGYLDEDGWLFLADRRSDMILSGGVNIYPAEIESVLLEHPAVEDAGVVGLPDPDWGNRVHAVVQPVASVTGDDALAKEILDHCNGKLAAYKRPRTLEFRELPRTATGKLSHSALRKTLLDELS
ncbi:long-chain acyl-CoA synthetase [Antricoccus suffuscus]|uniref:Long-chain acyl-CoA synthetase n=1 Tax=Antricoccus suffuscus TaxID=1629062 RepID=A0A2T1A2M3_9ACTN|nr:long-chain acyl-CoA synthetase [Antricoccus suffuscus]